MVDFRGECGAAAAQVTAQVGNPEEADPYNPDWRAQSEYMKYVSQFGDDRPNKLFDAFLKDYPLTRRASAKLRNFYYETISPTMVSGNIKVEGQENTLIGLFNIAMMELPLGLTTFDLTSNFHQVCILTRILFYNQLYKARDGKFFDRLTVQRSENYNFDGPVQQGRRDILGSVFGFGRRQ